MRIRQVFRAQPVGLVLGFSIASILFVAAFSLALTSGRVVATHGASGDIHTCVNQITNQARFIYPGLAPNCNANEYLINLSSGAAAADVEGRLAELEERLMCIQSAPGANSEVDDIVFTGCNVQVINGLGDTLTTNEVGNLIVGYNEDYMLTEDRSGSHNLVVGPNHTYSSYGGLVAGISSNVTAPYASVSGGNSNTASNLEASGERSSVSGGQNNEASGDYSSVGGEMNHTANMDHQFLP